MGWDMGGTPCLLSASHSLWMLSLEVFLAVTAVIAKQEQQKNKTKQNKQSAALPYLSPWSSHG